MSGAGPARRHAGACRSRMLLACLSRRVCARACRRCWALAPLPGLAAALLAADGPPLVLDEARLQFTLALDPPAAMLLGRRGAALERRGALCPDLSCGGEPSARPLRGLVAADADRQPRRVHRRRPRELLSDLRPGQPRGLGPRDPRRHAARRCGPARSTSSSRCSARSAC